MLGCGGVLVREIVRPARRVGGGSGTKFSLHAKSGPKSAFWGLLGEFCTGWACQGRLLGEFCTGWVVEPGVLGEFCTGWACQGRSLGEFCTGWAAEPGSRASFVSLRARRGLHRAFLAPIAPPNDAAVMRSSPDANRPPAHHARAGGNASISKHQQATQAVQTKRQEGRKQCKPRGLTSSRASRGIRWSRAAGSPRAGTGGSRPRARGAR